MFIYKKRLKIPVALKFYIQQSRETSKIYNNICALQKNKCTQQLSTIPNQTTSQRAIPQSTYMLHLRTSFALFKIKSIFRVALYTCVSETNEFLKKITYKMRLRDSFLSSLKKRTLRRDFTIVYSYLPGGYREDKAKFFLKMHSDNTKGSKHNLQ